MKRLKFSALAAVAIALLVAAGASANQFADPSFESPLTFDGPPFVGSWEGFAGGPASTANSAVMPRTGAGHVDFSITGANAFAGVFQDIPGLTAGSTWSFMGWHKAVGTTNVGPEIRIEWRDATSEISRTPNLVPPLSSDYTMFNLTATVPAGATIGRAVYAIQSFSPTGPGTVFVDDFSFKVPEPATVTLLGLSGLMLVGARRRRV